MASVAESRFSEDEKRRDADHISFLKHKRFRWLWIALTLSLLSIVGYAIIDQEPRPNGGSWYGYTLGTIGLLLIVWLSMLGIRKRRISEGAWSLKAWTSAHVYLGLALIVIGTLHTGFQFGWNLHTLAYTLMMFVILSGIYGVYAYAALPKELSTNRGDKTGGDMLDVITDIDKKLDSAAQPLSRSGCDLVINALNQDVFYGGAFARLANFYSGCATNRALNGIPSSGSEAEARVHELLSNRAEQLEQIRHHLRIKAMLEVWLFIHIPATIALLAALFAHVISVFYYW